MASVLVTHTAHFLRGPDGHVYAADPVLDHAFFSRYLTAFDHVTVAARVRVIGSGTFTKTPERNEGVSWKVPDPITQGWPRADGDGVTFCDLPDYQGPWGFLRMRGELTARFRDAIAAHQAWCLRVPCAHATLAWRELRRTNCRFGLEISGDPWDSLASGSYRSVARPLARWAAARDLRNQCRTASATAYVTRETIQRRYPPAPDAYTTHYSSIELPAESLAERPRVDFAGARRIVFVGSLAVLYKGPDVLIRAVARINRPDIELTLVGDGRERKGLIALAASLGIAARTRFTGTVPAGRGIRDVLNAADLFVLPSRTEGLPRAMIEAMACGLPCIGSTAGGIPELLPADAMVPPNDVTTLAARITAFLDDPERMRRDARRNLEAARDYLTPTLAARRRAFYSELRRVCCVPG